MTKRIKRMRTRKRGGFISLIAKLWSSSVDPQNESSTKPQEQLQKEPEESLMSKLKSMFKKPVSSPMRPNTTTKPTGPTITGGRKRYKGRNTRNKRRI